MDIQTNGSSHPDGGAEAHGGAQVIPMIIGGSGGDGAPFAEAVSETASRLHEQVEDNMQELKNKAAALDLSVQEQQEAAQRSEAQLQGVQRQLEALDQRLQSIEQSLRSGEQVVADLGEQVTGFTRTLDEQDAKVTNVTTSIGELSQDVTQLKQMQGTIAAARDELEALKSQVTPTSRTWLVALIVFIVIVGGYIALDKPGWNMVTGLIPGLG